MLSVEANFENMDPHSLTVGTTAVSFPAPDRSRVIQPEAIYVQAYSGNTASIFIGLEGVASDGTVGAFELPPFGNVLLKCTRDEILKAISSAEDQKLTVIYFSNPA